MKKRILSLLLCPLLTGCSISLGPKVETRYVIMYPGSPVQIVENKTMKVRALADEKGDIYEQDVGGWVAMPRSHFQVIKEKLEK